MLTKNYRTVKLVLMIGLVMDIVTRTVVITPKSVDGMVGTAVKLLARKQTMPALSMASNA